jgi:hypothetical protein
MGMKFKLIAYTTKDNSIIPCGYVGQYHIQSLCGKYRKNIRGYEYKYQLTNREGNIISYYNECALTRVVRRLEKIGISIELSCNVPWVYLDSINGVKVAEKKNARHGYCITYNTVDRRNLNFRKDLFNKIREILGE